MRLKNGTLPECDIPQMSAFDFLGGGARQVGHMGPVMVCGETVYSMQAVRESINHVFGEAPSGAQGEPDKNTKKSNVNPFYKARLLI